MAGMKTYVYIDGCNLYYGALRRTPHKWLDVGEFCQRLLPKHEIVAIKYFTAIVSDRPDDPEASTRQTMYLRALSTIPNLSIHYGHFVTRKVWARLVKPPAEGSQTVKVYKTEEKGSDVNLAAHLLLDAAASQCDCAVVISNDADLVFPVSEVKERFGIKVGVVNPHKARFRSRRLIEVADFFKQVRPRVVERSQLPDELSDDQGSIHKPASW